MRILYLSPWFPYPLDIGFRIRVYHQLRAMAQDHDVTLLTLDPQGWEPPQIEPIEPFCQQVVVIPRDPFRRGRLLRTACRFFALRPTVNSPFPEMIRLVRRLHAKHAFDVAVASSAVMAAYAIALPDVPRILEEHNSHSRWMHERYLSQTLPVRRLHCWVAWQKTVRYEARLFRCFDLVTMVSEQDASTSRRLLAGRRPPVSIVPNGVDCEYNRPGLAQATANALIFNGALTYSANYDAMHYFLNEIFPLVQKQVPTATLTITGSTAGVDLASFRLDQAVRLTGYVDDVRPVVAGATTCVVPIRQGGGTRLKILEAMALGTPVVATSKGAEGLNVTPDHNILITDLPDEFAAHVLRLLCDASLHDELATNARGLVEQQYDWKQIGRQFVSLIEGVASSRAPGGISS